MDHETARAGATIAAIPLWVMPALWSVSLVVVASAGYALWRELRRIQGRLLQALLAAGQARDELRRELAAVARSLEHAAKAPHLWHESELADHGAVRNGTNGNGSNGGHTRRRERQLFVVRRGEVDLFRTLQDHFEEPGLARVVWDRRIGDRRTTARPVEGDQRRRSRRRPPPYTWDKLHFLRVPQTRVPVLPAGR